MGEYMLQQSAAASPLSEAVYVDTHQAYLEAAVGDALRACLQVRPQPLIAHVPSVVILWPRSLSYSLLDLLDTLAIGANMHSQSICHYDVLLGLG